MPKKSWCSAQAFSIHHQSAFMNHETSSSISQSSLTTTAALGLVPRSVDIGIEVI